MVKGVILILLKETYLFLRNLYGLIVHPFKTIVRIRKKPDWSQTILVLGMPFWWGLGVLGSLGVVLIGFWFLKPGNTALVRTIFAGLGLSLLLTVTVTVYLGYWVGRYWVWRAKAKKKGSQLERNPVLT